jgi:hypothetical protein
VLAVCATPAATAQSAITPLVERSDDRDVQRQRFGAYADAVGFYWMGNWFKGQPYAIEYRWIVPGAVLEETGHEGVIHASTRYRFNPRTGRIDVHIEVDDLKVAEEIVEPDGTVFRPANPRIKAEEFRVRVEAGVLKLSSGNSGNVQAIEFRPGTQAEFTQLKAQRDALDRLMNKLDKPK